MATIYDVARVSGVSPKTVSRVINGDAAVKPSTKEKVQAAISTLGFDVLVQDVIAAMKTSPCVTEKSSPST